MSLVMVKPSANGRIIVTWEHHCLGKWADATPLPWKIHCDDHSSLSQHWMLHFASVCTSCCMLLDVVACCCAKFETGQTFRPATPNMSFVPWCRSVAQQCWICLQSSSNIVGATHAYYAWFTKTYGLYSSHDALQVPDLLGVVASVCTPLPTTTNIGATMLGVVAPVCAQP